MLGDRDATTLGYGVMRAFVERGLCGDVVLDTIVERAPSEAEVIERVHSVLPTPAPSRLDIDVPSVGRITGDIRAISDRAPAGIRQRIDERVARRPHDYRGFGSTVPLNGPHALDSIVLWMRGPRRTEAEHLGHIESRLAEAAAQLSGRVAGVIAIEMEGIADAELFRDKAPFRGMNARAFRQHRPLAAVLWRCDLDFAAVRGGFSPNHPTFVERNGACQFADAADVPLLNSRD
jgi:hypothetical protein